MSRRRSKRSRTEDIRIMGRLFPAADAIAASEGERSTGAEHLLIAALDLDDGSARRAFRRVGADPDQFGAAVRAQHAEALAAIGVSDADPLDGHQPPPTMERLHRGSPSSHELFRRVVKVVRRDRSQLHGAYFVLVAAELEHGTVARALRRMDIDPTALVDGARAEIGLLNQSPIDR